MLVPYETYFSFSLYLTARHALARTTLNAGEGARLKYNAPELWELQGNYVLGFENELLRINMLGKSAYRGILIAEEPPGARECLGEHEHLVHFPVHPPLVVHYHQRLGYEPRIIFDEPRHRHKSSRSPQHLFMSGTDENPCL